MMEAFIANFWVFAALAGIAIGFWFGWSVASRGGRNYAYYVAKAERLDRENRRVRELWLDAFEMVLKQRARIKRQAETIKELQAYMPQPDPLAWEDERVAP